MTGQIENVFQRPVVDEFVGKAFLGIVDAGAKSGR